MEIGETIDEHNFVILYSIDCLIDVPMYDQPVQVSLSPELQQITDNATITAAKVITFSQNKRINIAISFKIEGDLIDQVYDVKISDFVDIKSGTFFGLYTDNQFYPCDPPKNSICEQGIISDDFYTEMITSILNCLKSQKQDAGTDKVGDAFFFAAKAKHPENEIIIRQIADKYDEIANILFQDQQSGNEWQQYGEYFEAAFEAALKADNIDNGDYLKRLNQFIKIFEEKLAQLNTVESDKIALFVGTFTDNELIYLPMKLRIKVLNSLSNSMELYNLLDPIKRVTAISNWAMRENMILKLLELIEPGTDETKKLVEELRKSNVIEAINNNLDDFITLVDNNYDKFLDIIDNYVYYVNTISEHTRGEWLQKLYDDDKVFNISEITKEGERYISATGITGGNIQLQLKEFSGEYALEFVSYGGVEGSYVKTPQYNTVTVNVAYDQPITIYHNTYLSGVPSEKIGTMQIASALRVHYYLQKHKDEVTSQIIWSTIDVATLFVGVGEISAAMKAAKGWRLVLGITNTVSSVGSLLATGMESYLVTTEEGREFVESLRRVSAILGFADLGAAGVRKFKNMLNDDLATISKFHKKHGAELKARNENFEQTIKKLADEYDDYDEYARRLIDNAGDLSLKSNFDVSGIKESIKTILKNKNYTDADIAELLRVNYIASTTLRDADVIMDQVKTARKVVEDCFSIPANEKMIKFVSLDEVNTYHVNLTTNVNTVNNKSVSGFVAKAQDYELTGANAKQVYNDFRLDYKATGFAENKGYAVLEYDNVGKVDRPYNVSNVLDKAEAPQTLTGMTGSFEKIIPEFYIETRTDLKAGATLKIFDANGNLEKIFTLKSDKITGKLLWQ
jgi:hypothetical protein